MERNETSYNRLNYDTITKIISATDSGQRI